MDKIRSHRTTVALLGSVVMVIVGILFISSANPALCSSEDPQCEVLKDRIENPRDNSERNRRYYYCEQMKNRNCSAHKTLCEDSSDKAASTDTTCWKWTWKMNKERGGSEYEAVLTMFSDKRVTLSKYDLKGTWRSEGATYWIDWGRGEGKEDVMTLSGDTLTGSNFETEWIKGEKTPCT